MPAARRRDLPSGHRDPTTGDRQEGVRRHVPSEPAPHRGTAPHRPDRPAGACLVAGCTCKDARIVSFRRAAFFAAIARRTGETADRVIAPDPELADPIVRRSLTPMTIHPLASSRASCSSPAASRRRCHGARDRAREAPRRCRDGRSARPTPLLLDDLIAVLPVHRRLRRRRSRRRRGPPRRQVLGGRRGSRDRDRRRRRRRDRADPAVASVAIPSPRLPRPARPTTGSASSAPSPRSTSSSSSRSPSPGFPGTSRQESRHDRIHPASPLRPPPRHAWLRGLRDRPRRVRRPRRRRRRPADHGARLDRGCRGSSR